MSRVYINGVHDFSYDGKNLSFTLTDTHEVKTGEVRKTVSFHCVSELNVIEDICKYIIKEIDTIKSMSKVIKNETKIDKKVSDNKKVKLGRKIDSVDLSHV
ncbi:hypothetical protein OA253_03630 [Alphaproteobacteria bacterium]|nr:hypothetical protein [Alphaproteobacteria bacterium]